MPRPTIFVLNGPNLNKLGLREPEIYGRQTLNDIERLCREEADRLGLDVDFRQSNYEGELVTWIQKCRAKVQGVVINAAAYTHTSLAIHDALKLLDDIPVVEVHLSNPKEREAFRHFSYIEPLAFACFAGHGPRSYVMALEALAEKLGTK